MAVLFEVFFYFEGGHAAGPRCRNCLAITAVLDVAAGVDAGQRCLPFQGGEHVMQCSYVRMYPSSSRSIMAFEHARALGTWPMPRNMKDTGRMYSSLEARFC